MTSSYIISLRHISNHKCAAAQRLGTNALDQPYLILPGFFFLFMESAMKSLYKKCELQSYRSEAVYMTSCRS